MVIMKIFATFGFSGVNPHNQNTKKNMYQESNKYQHRRYIFTYKTQIF